MKPKKSERQIRLEWIRWLYESGWTVEDLLIGEWGDRETIAAALARPWDDEECTFVDKPHGQITLAL